MEETFIPAGLTLRENRYENLFGCFNGLYRRYGVETVREYTANTGILNESMADWIEDMFSSRDVFLLPAGGGKKEITVTEATVKRSSAPDALPAYEFKYRLSKSVHMEYAEPRRIFNDSHNNSFN